MALDTIKDIVENVIKNISDKTGGITRDEIVKIWGGVVGKKFAKHSKPTAFKTSKLTVNVDNSGWLYELALHKTEILKKLKKKFKEKSLEEIQFRIGEV